MTLRFKDQMGRWGKVTTSLDIEYSGEWKREVKEAVASLKEDPPDDDIFDPDNPLSYLVVELPERAPITEVSREDSRTASHPE